MSAPNSCVYCIHEAGGDGRPLYCTAFREQLLHNEDAASNPKHRAFRDQVECPRFSLVAGMAERWHEHWGPGGARVPDKQPEEYRREAEQRAASSAAATTAKTGGGCFTILIGLAMVLGVLSW